MHLGINRAGNGFTLIEMIIVLGIISVIAAIVAINFTGQKANNAVTVSAQVLASDIKLAKDIASKSLGGAQINFIPGANGTASVAIVSNGAVVRQDALVSPIILATSWGANTIVFNQNGTTNSFTNTGTITLGSPSASITKTIQVNSATGDVIQ